MMNRQTIAAWCLLLLPTVCGTSRTCAKTPNTILWYRGPATTWVEALPIGNGSLGAMVFGNPAQEHLQFNQDTLWSGGPEDYINPKANPQLLTKVRELLLAGKQKEAEEISAGLMSDPLRQMAYQPFGDLWIDMPKHAHVRGYRRELDLDSATVTVTYQHDDVIYQREVFASYPDQAIIVRLTANKPNSVSIRASLTSPHADINRNALDDVTLGLQGRVADFHHQRIGQVFPGQVKIAAQLRTIADGGTTHVGKDAVEVQEANAVTLVLVAATSYRSYCDLSGDPAARCNSNLQPLASRSIEELRQRHVDDHRKLFRRCRLDLGDASLAALPTDERQTRLKATADPAFAALLFHYGRYLMIAGSRPGSQPVNLQGIWNDNLNPSWESKYTTNINLGMNYWPAESTNLSECHDPLFDLLRDVSKTGAKVAREHYAMDGWVLHHNTDGWRGAAAINATNHGIWPTGGAWLAQHLWWRYEFSGDIDFLRDTAYPLMKGASVFFLDWLIEDPRDVAKRLISGPSNSPENGGLVMGPTMDHQILRHLFASTAEAAKILDVDAAFRQELLRVRDRIAPNQIGRYGQLQEWLEDKDDPKNTHRHISHMWGLHPGDEITPQATPALADGCKVALEHRGMGNVGWSLAWQVNLWARLGDGQRAARHLANCCGTT